MFLCVACGYQVAQDGGVYSAQTIFVPYVKNDIDGRLTDALIKAVDLSNQFVYARNGGWILEAQIISDQTENIGYQYDRKPVTGKRIDRLVPNEACRLVKVRFSLIQRATGQSVYGPIDVVQGADFDFADPDSLRDTSFIDIENIRRSSLFFSLGQFDSMAGAKEDVVTPLYWALAKKIVLGVEHLNWHSFKE